MGTILISLFYFAVATVLRLIFECLLHNMLEAAQLMLVIPSLVAVPVRGLRLMTSIWCCLPWVVSVRFRAMAAPLIFFPRSSIVIIGVLTYIPRYRLGAPWVS